MIRSLPAIILLAITMCGAQTPTPASQSDSRPTGTTAAPQQQPAPSQNPAPPSNTPTPKQQPKEDEDKAPTTNPAVQVPTTASVITIQGVCSPTAAGKTGTAAAAKAGSSKTAATGPCKTVVTKAQFEKILEAVNPGNQPVAPVMKRNLAQTYVDLLAFSQAAHKAGIDKDPNFNEYMRLIKMKTLQDFYRRNLEKQDRTPPESEIQAYYHQNLSKYEQIKLSRIFIPAKNPSAANKDDWEKKAAQEANDIHDRAVKGEDLEKLQKEAYTTLGLTIAPPATNTGTRRRGMLPAGEEKELFELKSGEVSKVQQEPAGYIIYKIENRETLPEAQVKDEISRELFRQKMDSQLKSVTAGVHADFNDLYFGNPNSGPAAVRVPGRPGGVPPAARERPGEEGEPASPGVRQPAPTPSPTTPTGKTSPSTPGQSPPK